VPGDKLIWPRGAVAFLQLGDLGDIFIGSVRTGMRAAWIINTVCRTPCVLRFFCLSSILGFKELGLIPLLLAFLSLNIKSALDFMWCKTILLWAWFTDSTTYNNSQRQIFSEVHGTIYGKQFLLFYIFHCICIDSAYKPYLCYCVYNYLPENIVPKPRKEGKWCE
jgi:hypothetical protein